MVRLWILHKQTFAICQCLYQYVVERVQVVKNRLVKNDELDPSSHPLTFKRMYYSYQRLFDHDKSMEFPHFLLVITMGDLKDETNRRWNAYEKKPKVFE